MYRFYVEEEQISEKQITIEGSDVNHIRNVLRLQLGEWVVVCDGGGRDYYCLIEEIAREAVLLSVQKIQDTGTELPSRIVLFQGIPKKDKMEFIIQKAVELGVCQVVPVMTKRSVVKLNDAGKIKKKTERWQTIAEAAAKQCDRGIIPEVKEPVTLKEALQMAKDLAYNLIPYELAEGKKDSRKIIKEAVQAPSIGIFIGPEGGFEKEEVELAMQQGCHSVTLGKRILRTETAGMVVLSILMFEMEE